MTRSSPYVVALLGAALALVGLASCEDDPTAQPCTGVPEGGCPLSRGVACEDPTCEAVYACRPNNVWELERTCPPREAGAPRDAATDVDAAPTEDARAFDASIDAPPGANGGPGCGSLQTPDCSLGLALSCPSGCCGCEDLFVCENGGWTYWATCQ
jgi:hypothetical protein